MATDRTMLDLANSDTIRRMVREVEPDLIVNAAAYTAVDRAESELEAAMQVNGIAPGILAEEAKRLGALLVHYSTDYIFDGEKRSPYCENDAPNPINAYGRSKLEGEIRIAASGCRHLLLRTSWVYAQRGRNFYLTVLRKANAGQRLRIVDDQTGTPTPSAFLAQHTTELLQKGAAGLLHLVPSGSTTWFGFAREILRRTGSDSAIDPISTAEYPSAAARPAYSVLDNRKAAELLGRALPPWKELLP
jgi:dTDP-4-dehydrorhamnose reductase